MKTKFMLTVKNGGRAGETFEFAGRRRFIIGRGSDCDLRLPNDFEFLCVSRHHCLIDTETPQIRIRDLGSRNGTCINGMEIGRPIDWRLDAEVTGRISPDYPLQNGDELKIGSTIFQVHVDAAGDGDIQATPAFHEEAEMAPASDRPRRPE